MNRRTIVITVLVLLAIAGGVIGVLSQRRPSADEPVVENCTQTKASTPTGTVIDLPASKFVGTADQGYGTLTGSSKPQIVGVGEEITLSFEIKGNDDWLARSGRLPPEHAAYAWGVPGTFVSANATVFGLDGVVLIPGSRPAGNVITWPNTTGKSSDGTYTVTFKPSVATGEWFPITVNGNFVGGVIYFCVTDAPQKPKPKPTLEIKPATGTFADPIFSPDGKMSFTVEAKNADAKGVTLSATPGDGIVITPTQLPEGSMP